MRRGGGEDGGQGPRIGLQGGDRPAPLSVYLWRVSVSPFSALLSLSPPGPEWMDPPSICILGRGCSWVEINHGGFLSSQLSGEAPGGRAGRTVRGRSWAPGQPQPVGHRPHAGPWTSKGYCPAGSWQVRRGCRELGQPRAEWQSCLKGDSGSLGGGLVKDKQNEGPSSPARPATHTHLRPLIMPQPQAGRGNAAPLTCLPDPLPQAHPGSQCLAVWGGAGRSGGQDPEDPASER